MFLFSIAKVQLKIQTYIGFPPLFVGNDLFECDNPFYLHILGLQNAIPIYYKVYNLSTNLKNESKVFSLFHFIYN